MTFRDAFAIIWLITWPVSLVQLLIDLFRDQFVRGTQKHVMCTRILKELNPFGLTATLITAVYAFMSWPWWAIACSVINVTSSYAITKKIHDEDDDHWNKRKRRLRAWVSNRFTVKKLVPVEVKR